MLIDFMISNEDLFSLVCRLHKKAVKHRLCINGMNRSAKSIPSNFLYQRLNIDEELVLYKVCLVYLFKTQSFSFTDSLKGLCKQHIETVPVCQYVQIKKYGKRNRQCAQQLLPGLETEERVFR